MATTVGHALAGVDCLLIYRAINPSKNVKLGVLSLLGMMFFANAPDLDIIVSAFLSNDHLKYHGQQSHTPFYMLFFSLMMALLLLKTPLRSFTNYSLGEQSYKTVFSLVFIALLSHSILDLFTGPLRGLHNSFGTPILAPFWPDRVSSPITLLIGPHHDTADRFFDWYNVWVVLSELLIFVPITFMILLLSKKMR